MSTKQIEALKLALEALEPFITPNWAGTGVDKANEAYAAIREALAEQPAQQQEPVAWKDRTYGNLHHQDFGNSIPLYTSPQPSKPWVGLTDDEIGCIADEYSNLQAAFRAIEAKLREKNT